MENWQREGERPLTDASIEALSPTQYSRVSSRRRCRAGPGSRPSGACGNGGTWSARCPGAAQSGNTETGEPLAGALEQTRPLPGTVSSHRQRDMETLPLISANRGCRSHRAPYSHPEVTGLSAFRHPEVTGPGQLRCKSKE